MDTQPPLDAADKAMLQAHVEALLITMDRLAVKEVSIEPKNFTKNGARVNLVPMKK